MRRSVADMITSNISGSSLQCQGVAGNHIQQLSFSSPVKHQGLLDDWLQQCPSICSVIQM